MKTSRYVLTLMCALVLGSGVATAASSQPTGVSPWDSQASVQAPWLPQGAVSAGEAQAVQGENAVIVAAAGVIAYYAYTAASFCIVACDDLWNLASSYSDAYKEGKYWYQKLKQRMSAQTYARNCIVSNTAHSTPSYCY